ncbi:Maf-domain-containing protein [Aureobasidium pullulans]|nr:Maf-domain-containing protein [Aureobasidium pullulans]
MTLVVHKPDTMSDQKMPLEPPPAYDADSEHTPLVAGAPAPVRQQIARAPLPLELPALQALRGKRVILASASPRRKQLLNQIGLRDLEIIPCTVPEDFSKTLAPFEYVLQTAEQKCTTIYRQEIDSEKGEPALVIAADTVVVSPMGDILEKPRSEREHIAVLKGLRNSGWHKVYTAVVCMAPLESAMDPGYALKRHVEETNVKFDSAVSDELILAYVKTREGADKAGGYGIQGMGAILVEKIDGSYDNVVGLPLNATMKLMGKVLNPEIEADDDDEAEED